MANKLTVQVTTSCRVHRRTPFEVDLDEFKEWGGGADPDPKKIKEFIEAHRDYDEIAEILWEDGKDLSEPYEFVDIERIEL